MLSHNDLLTIKNNFIEELSRAESSFIAKQKNLTSLAYIVTEISPSPLVKKEEKFQVQIVGGTLGGKAICTKHNDQITVLKEELDMTLPPLTSKKDFLSFIASSLEDDISVLSVNFAYPLEPFLRDGRLDGILLDIGTSGKAVSAPDLIGEKIGESIEKYIKKTLQRSVCVSVGNDSLCLALAGKNLPGIDEDKLGFGIVGTGINFGFFLNKNMVVNLENHAFTSFPQSELGKILSDKAGSPFGKETNGETLYKHFNFFLKKEDIDFPPLTATSQLDEIIKKNMPVLSDVARAILKRSAELIACQVSGILDFKKTDMTFVMEGGLFWHGIRYGEIVENTIGELTNHKSRFVKINNSNLFGAAKLVS